MQSRRLFLHTGAALAVPIMGEALIRRQTTAPPAPCTECPDDPVSVEALRQWKASIRSLVTSAKGEHARQAGAALRILAANAAARNVDGDLRGTIGREVRTYGRDNVLMRPFDRNRFARTAAEFGVSPAPELLTAPTLDQKRRALDSLASRGAAAHLQHAAEFFDAAAARLDARGPLRSVQTKEDEIAYCKGAQNFVFSAEVMMITACLVGGPIACAYFSGVYVGARYYYDYQTDCKKWLG